MISSGDCAIFHGQYEDWDVEILTVEMNDDGDDEYAMVQRIDADGDNVGEPFEADLDDLEWCECA